MSKFVHIAAVLLAVLAFASAYNVVVPAGKIECFMEDINEGDKVVGSFNVLLGGAADIDVKLTDPQDKAVYSEEKETYGTFTFVASHTGSHKLCFSNLMSTVTAKTVNFHMHVGNALVSHSVAKKEHLTGLEMSVVSFSEGMKFLEDELDYLKTRERVHRDTNESTNTRVMWWSFFENGVLIAMSVGQIYYLKSFFEQRRNI